LQDVAHGFGIETTSSSTYRCLFAPNEWLVFLRLHHVSHIAQFPIGISLRYSATVSPD
jgi:hypothetical protein